MLYDKEGRRIVLIKPGEKLIIPQKGSGDGYKPRVESYTSNAKAQESSKQNLESQVKQLVSEVKKSDLPESAKKMPNSKIMPEDGFYGPQEVFRDQYDKAVSEIDKMDVSDALKKEYSDDIYKSLQKVSDGKIDVRAPEKPGFDWSEFLVSKAHASPAHAAIIVGGACAKNPACSALAAATILSVTKAIENTATYLKKQMDNKQADDKLKQEIAGNYGSPNGDPDDWDPEDKKWTKNKDGKWHHSNSKDLEGIHNKPNAENERLKKVLDELYRAKDKGPGGTAGELRREIKYGKELKHLQKAKDRLKNLEKISSSEQLSSSDKKLVDRLRNDLKSAIKLVKERE